jgi:hypothetical protein
MAIRGKNKILVYLESNSLHPLESIDFAGIFEKEMLKSKI